MIFKGHFSLLEQPLNYTKTTIYSIQEDNDFIHKEYFYSNNKVLKIIDHINHVISEYEYLNDKDFVVRFYLFEESITEKKLDSIKEICELNGKKIKEVLINIEKGEKSKIYTGEYTYSGEYLAEETYTYSEEEIYKIKHEWDDKKLVNTITHIGESESIQYTFDQNGFMQECLHFKYEGSVKKTEYEYKDQKLFKLVQFPHLEYKKTLFGKGFKIIEEAQFMDETEYYYLANGLLEKEIIKDYETKEIIRTTYYKYQ